MVKNSRFGDRPLYFLNELGQVASTAEATGSLWTSFSASVK